MNAVDIVLESCKLDPFQEMYDPWNYFKEYDEFSLEEYILEDTAGGVKKKNILQKIWGMITKLLGAIIGTISKILGWAKEAVFGKKEVKSVDQILHELNVPRSKEARDPNRKIPWDDTSDPNAVPNHIELMMKPMMVSIDSDAGFTFTAMDYIKNSMNPGRQGIVQNTSHGGIYDPRAFMMVMKFITKPDLMTELEAVADAVDRRTIDYNTIDKINKVFDSAILEVNINPTYKVTVREMQTFNSRLAAVQKKMQALDDTTQVIGGNTEASVKALTKLYYGLGNIQAGATLIGTALRRIYVIDPEYCETISDPIILGKFVDKMIMSGCQDKYVAFNAWMAATSVIKGKDDGLKPRWGFSRATFLPPNPAIVYKIAINGWGVRSNVAERKISNAVYNAGVGERFAKIIDSDPSGSLVTMERVVIDKERAAGKAGEVAAAMAEAFKKAGIPGKVGDVRAANIGFRGDLAVSCDYGVVNRVANKDPVPVGATA